MRFFFVAALAVTASCSSAQRMEADFVKEMMEQSLERKSKNGVNERNRKEDGYVLQRNVSNEKMATKEHRQNLQSRLLKRARGLIKTVDNDDDDEEYHTKKARSLKGTDSKAGDVKKDDKLAENKSPGPNLVHPSPAYTPPKAKDTNQKDKVGDNSSDPQVAHPSPANAPQSEEDDTKQKDKSGADSNRPGTVENKKSSDTKSVNPFPATAPSKEDDITKKDKAADNDQKSQPVSPSGSKGDDSSEKSSSRTSSEFSSSQSSSSSSSSSSQGRSSKSSKGGTTCDKRLTTAYNQIRALPDDFGVVTSPSEITAACAFDPTRGFNLGCPFVYDPTKNGFVDSEEMYQTWFENDAVGSAYWSFVLYCQCHQAFDLNCAVKVPHGPPSSKVTYGEEEKFVNSYSEFIPASTPENRLNYCQMAGVWNGDFDIGVVRDFGPGVRDCGCYFVGTAKDMVGTCPGVDLGAYSAFLTTEGSDEASILVTENFTMENATYYPTVSPSDE